MAANSKRRSSLKPGQSRIRDLSIALNEGGGGGDGQVTARLAGELHDMQLDVSPAAVGAAKAVRNLAKAINVAFQHDFLPTELEPAYKAARSREGRVELLHREYIGLGDGVMAKIGRGLRSIRLSLEGPDPGSPQGRRKIQAGEGGAVKGLASLLARKLDLIQEYEDMVPTFVEQMLDRLESVRLLKGWNREEWTIETTPIGLDVHLAPVGAAASVPAKKASKKAAKRAKKAHAAQASSRKKTAKKSAKKSAKKASKKRSSKRA